MWGQKKKKPAKVKDIERGYWGENSGRRDKRGIQRMHISREKQIHRKTEACRRSAVFDLCGRVKEHLYITPVNGAAESCFQPHRPSCRKAPEQEVKPAHWRLSHTQFSWRQLKPFDSLPSLGLCAAAWAPRGGVRMQRPPQKPLSRAGALQAHKLLHTHWVGHTTLHCTPTWRLWKKGGKLSTLSVPLHRYLSSCFKDKRSLTLLFLYIYRHVFHCAKRLIT